MQIFLIRQLPHQVTLKTTAAQAFIKILCSPEQTNKVPEDKDIALHSFPFKPHGTKQEEILKKHA